jgi:hypothetical protein
MMLTAACQSPQPSITAPTPSPGSNSATLLAQPQSDAAPTASDATTQLMGMRGSNGSDLGGIEKTANEIRISGYTLDELQAARNKKSPARVRLMAPQVSGELDVATVRRYVTQVRDKLDLCYTAGLQDDPKLGGDVTIEFVIGQQGSVATASSTKKSKVITCLVDVIFRAPFPAPKSGVVKVSYPMKLQPPD